MLDLLGYGAYQDYIFVPLAVAAVFAALARLPSGLGSAGVLAASLAFCLAAQAGVMRNGISTSVMLAGLLPVSDAGGYLSDAWSLVHGDPLSPFSSRRPLFAGFLSVLLKTFGGDLRASVVALTLLTAGAIAAATHAVARSDGWVAGAVLFLALFVFARRFIGTAMTETLGLPLGALGFALLWRGARTDATGPVVLGLLALTLGLAARAGAFFVLPALLIWFACRWRRRRPIALAVAVFAVALGFAANRLLLELVGDGSLGFSNFAYVLYGLVHGGDWRSAMTQHPGLAALADAARAAEIYRLALDRIAAQPLDLVAGMARAWFQFFLSINNLFSFFLTVTSGAFAVVPVLAEGGRLHLLRTLIALPLDYDRLNVLASLALFAVYSPALPWALVRMWRRRREPAIAMLACAFAGIVASVPFAPPWDANWMRVYAATIPLIAALPAIALARPAGAATAAKSRSVAAVTMLLILACIVGPVAVQRTGERRAAPAAACSSGTGASADIQVARTNAVRLVDRASSEAGAVAIGRFRRNLTSLRQIYPEPAAYLAGLAPDTALAPVFDLDARVYRLAVGPDAVLAQGGDGIATLCGRPRTVAVLPFFELDAVARPAP